MGDEIDGLREVRLCAATECGEDVAFSVIGTAARSDAIKYRGTCPNGHRNVRSPDIGQWIEEDA